MSEQYLQTPYGFFAGISSAASYPDGKLESVILNEPNLLLTHAGELIPLHDPDLQRRKHKGSVVFHPNGMVKSVSLQEQQDVVTPIGEFPAEFVTFYETGELHRLFVLDGQLSGFWTEEDERANNIPFSFDLGFARFSALLTGICFYRSGAIRSITLFPGEVVRADAGGRGGEIAVRTGFSLYESGALQSLEPAEPVLVSTPIGKLSAYDVNAIGVHADSNSLAFDEQSRVIRLTTSSDRIAVLPQDGPLLLFEALTVPSPLDPEKKALVPLRICFDYAMNAVTITDNVAHHFSLTDTFAVFSDGEDNPTGGGCSPSDCANCSLCKK